MTKTSDLKFFTNKDEDSLYNRFITTTSNAEYFDILVGYFRTSGFARMHKHLEKVSKIRILVGLNVDKNSFELIQKSKTLTQLDLQSCSQNKETYINNLCNEIENDEDDKEVSIAAKKFIEFINSKKLELRVYPDKNLHAKVYITRHPEDYGYFGSVITGSSNFSENGLVAQREFNVELKDTPDVKFALKMFEELWEKGIEVSQEYIDTIENKTWLNDKITPYQIYLKFLYEYFKDEIEEENLYSSNRPDNFKELKYQTDAVIAAKKIINEHNGVFLSDVVGLGKTFMGVMLCQELNKKVLVIAPPHLVDANNLGGWNYAFSEFGFRKKDFECYSLGKLDEIIEKEIHKDFDIILIDESHRFRSPMSDNYTKLAQICVGKQVILVSATPYNNSPQDLLSQIRLFQSAKKSTIPHIADLEYFFNSLKVRLKGLDRQNDKDEFARITKENAKDIRQKILKHLMVRRTRKEISRFYGDDLAKQNVKFPEIVNPHPIYYEFDDIEDEVFNKTLAFISNDLSYSRYTPKLFLFDGYQDKQEIQGQKNMKGFIKTILFKRLESSFSAFKKTIDRLVTSYEKFIKEYENGFVYVSKTHSKKIFEYLENDEIEKIDELIEKEKAEKYEAKDFKDDFSKKLEKDLKILIEIQNLWEVNIERDPKIIAFKKKLSKEPPFEQQKSIIFTESGETAKYLEEQLKGFFNNKVICFTGGDGEKKREEVLANFDANAKKPKNDYKILITTDVLAEGVNLHRADVVVNYDIPWNPARMMQRVGRINRVDTKFNKIYTYNFFPTKQSNDVLKLEESASNKISAFISMLGNDAKLLTEDEEITSHNLFNKLFSKEALEGDEEQDSELEYLQEIRAIYNDDKKLFEQIKKLPKKARSTRQANNNQSSLITYFKKGKSNKFFEVVDKIKIAKELDFVEAAKILKTSKDEKKLNLDQNFYDLLSDNKSFFEQSLNQEGFDQAPSKKGSRDNYKKLATIIKWAKKSEDLGDDEFDFLTSLETAIDEAIIPPKKIKDINKSIKDKKLANNPIELIKFLQKNIPDEFLQQKLSINQNKDDNKIEVILSQYFKANQ
jgi:superfamily II DNA or RNA helicase